MKPTHRNRIAELRAAKGMRQHELARALGALASQVSKIERGETPLSQDWIVRFAKALARDPWELLPEWVERSPAEHIEVLWPQTTAEDKERLLRKYLATYQATVGTRPDVTFIEPQDASSGGSTLMLVEVKGDNLARVSFFRPVVPDKNG